MKGINRTWLTLLVLALIVGVAYYLLEVRKIAEKPEETEYVWALEEGQEITAIEVSDLISGTVTKVEKGWDGWQVTRPITGPADATACESLAYTLSHLMVRRTIEHPAEEDMQAYGLQSPAYRVTIWVGERNMALEVGVRHPGGAYYVRRLEDGPGPVLMVTDYLLDEVLRILQEPPLATPPTATPGLPAIGPEPMPTATP